MPKTRYRAVCPDGSIVRRSTESRQYSHCVVYRLSYNFAIHDANNPHPREVRNRRSNYAYYRGELDPATAKCQHSDAELARYRAYLGDAQSVEEFLEAQRVAAVEEVEQARLNGRYDTWFDAGWCGRPDLAQRLAVQMQRKEHVAEARILEAVKSYV
jgi:hypothetical protein